MLEIHRRTEIKRFPVLVSRNTYPNQRPWRISVFLPDKSYLALPHLTVSERPETPEEVSWHLENQIPLYAEFDGEILVQPTTT